MINGDSSSRSGGGGKFNYYKSYKDAKEKPKNYGKKIQRNHPITEYLSPEQMKMFQKRYGPDESDAMFDNNWSGKNTIRSNPQRRKLFVSDETYALRGSIDTVEVEPTAWLDRAMFQPPLLFTESWWVYVILLFGIVISALALVTMVFVLCCLALHPPKKEDDDDGEEDRNDKNNSHSRSRSPIGIISSWFPTKDIDA